MTGCIVLAVYRPEPKLLRTQLDSLAQQVLGDWVCLVGLDGPDAAARAVVLSAVEGDDRFQLIEFSEQQGVYRHFERLLGRVPTDAEWVALCDQDDRWYPEKLSWLVPRLDGVDLVAGSARVVGPAVVGEAPGRTLRRPFDLVSLVLDNQVTGSLAVFRRDLLDTALPFPEPTPSAYHDHWLGVCAEARSGVRLYTEVVQDYVQHGTNVIGEERGARLGRRLGRLVSAFRFGPLGPVRVLAEDRWGWRSTMARTLLARVPGGHHQSRDLEAIARGRPAGRLLVMLARRVARGYAAPARVTALAAGALAARVLTGGTR